MAGRYHPATHPQARDSGVDGEGKSLALALLVLHSGMAYAKLFSTITESSLWGSSKEARLLFVSMLAKANSVGFVEAALPGLARLSNLTMEETERALGELMAPDPYSKSPEAEGRRIVPVEHGWCLVNYESYRLRRDEEERRTYMREYMARYRKKPENDVRSRKQSKPELAKGEGEAEAAPEGEGETRPPAKASIQKDLEAAGVKMDKNGEDLYPEWQKACKGLKRAQVLAILKETIPGIEWPSEFKAERKRRGI